jgi:serine/threonine protein kinase
MQPHQMQPHQMQPRPMQPHPVQQQMMRPQNSMSKRKVQLDNFSFLAVLGKGNFGKVMLAEEKFDKQLYAIKMLKKRFIIDNDEIER